VLYQDGVPIATSVAGEFAALVTLDAQQTQAARRALALDAPLRLFELAMQQVG
jgi:ATP-dependent Lhr-like helicase